MSTQTSWHFLLGNPKMVAESAVQPTISMAGQAVVTMFRDSTAILSNLYYRAGTIDDKGVISLGSKKNVANNNVGDADKGETPSIAINSQGTVVEIHEANGTSIELWTHVGTVPSNDANTIVWGNHQDTNHQGRNPCIALCNFQSRQVAVAAYISGTKDTVIYFLVGIVDSAAKTISWQKSQTQLTGRNPSIAVNDIGKVVLVYEDETDHGTIKLVNGNLNIYYDSHNVLQTEIVWYNQGTIVTNDSDGDGAVSLANNQAVVVVYQGKVITDDILKVEYKYAFPIKARYGTLGLDGSFEWESDELHGSGIGKKPGIATNGSVVASIQETPDVIEAGINFNDSDVYMASSPIKNIYVNRESWMNGYRTKSLNQLCIPAAHDAGMSTVGYCTDIAELHSETGTKTQSKNFKEMLDCGIRYFDVRPVWLQDGLNPHASPVAYTGHFSDKMGGIGCLGITMQEIINQVNNFIEEFNKEVIILKFSHYFLQTKFNDVVGSTTIDTGAATASIFNPLKKSLIDLLLNSFNNALYQRPNGETRRLVEIPIQNMTNSRCTIIAVFDQVDMDALYPIHGVSSSVQAQNQEIRNKIHTYGDYYVKDQQPPSKNNFDMVVYDRYTNTDLIGVMVSDSAPSDAEHPGQIYQFNNQSFHTGSDLYLLSWTLTQQASREVITGSPSIETLASIANASLGSFLQGMLQKNQIVSTGTVPMIPNLVYTDFCAEFVTDACNFVNASIQ